MAEKHPPTKKRKLELTKTYTSAEQIRHALRAQSPDATVNALNQLRNQLTIRSDEGVISPQDERLLLVQSRLEKSPGAQDVFDLWENGNPRQPNLPVAVVSVLAALLSVLSSHYTYHALGHPIVKALLAPKWIRRLNSYVGGAHNELILVSLKLLNAISAFAGGREKKTLLEVFQWEIKSLPRLLNLRRRSKVVYNPLSWPDIRTLYVQFLLSFLDAPTQIKSMFLEQHRDAFLGIFKGLPQDHYLFVRHVLEVIWAHLWSDPKIKRTTKIGLFTETTISHLLKIYERSTSDDEDPDHIPADLVHHFLLAIATRPGTGICFRDRGWYPREEHDDEKGGKIYNKILAGVLKQLKVNEDSRQQELARRILEACPELVAGYWPSAQLTLEPRLSSKWIANISFFGTIISLPIPQSTFFLPDTNLYNPTPPPLQTILSNILPSDISPKNIFTKGLLSPSGLVQHCTALVLAKCLVKYAKVLEVFRVVEDALEAGDTEEGLWGKRRREVEKELRKRVPEFQVVVGFSQQKSVLPPAQVTATQQAANPVKNALVQESAQRLLFLYHKYLHEVVAEARFDVGKALSSFTSAGGIGEEERVGEAPDPTKKFLLVQQLHVLRTLKESDQFVWMNKSSSSRTYFYILLKSYATTLIPALKSTLLNLLSHLLSNSIIFREAHTEPRLWLLSLPRLIRSPSDTSPDQAELTGEAEGVVTFLDDCIQRCLKTPFRYIEDMRGLTTRSPGADEHGVDENSEIYPSPLVMTLGEQLDAKINAELLTPSAVLAIASFVRKLVFRLSSQVQDLSFLEAFVRWVDRILSEGRLWTTKYPVMTAAVRREIQTMYAVMKPVQVDIPISSGGAEAFLDVVERLPIADRNYDRIVSAHSIIDRLRFFDQPLSSTNAKRLVLAVQAHWAPALPDLAQYLSPRSGSLWENHVLVGADVGETIAAKWLFHNSTKEQVVDLDYRRSFVAAFLSETPTLQSCLELFRLIEHRLGVVEEEEIRGLLSLLSVLMSEAQPVLEDGDMVALKESLFVRAGTVKRLAMAQDVDARILFGLRELLQSSFDPRSAADRRILSEISAHWLAFVQQQLNFGAYEKFSDTALWITFLPSDQILRLLDELTKEEAFSRGPHVALLLQSLLVVIQGSIEDDAAVGGALRERIPLLLKIRKQLVELQVVEDLLLSAVDSMLPVGYSGCNWDPEPDSMPFIRHIERAESHWANRAHPLGCTIPSYEFLTSQNWSSSTVKIIAALLYKQGFLLKDFETWLKSENSTSRSPRHIAIVIRAALDVYCCTSPSTRGLLDEDTWVPHLVEISALCFDHAVESSLRRISTSALVSALGVFSSRRSDLVQALTQHVDRHRNSRPTLESLRLGCQYPTQELTATLLEWSLHWLIGQLADDTFLSTETLRLIEDIRALVPFSTSVQVHQVETLLGVVIQHHLSNPAAIGLANHCASKTQLKPVAVNRYLQSILHHPQFSRLANGTHSNTPRPFIVQFLHTLFNLHPTNTCQITQIEPLLQIYHGTLSKEDFLLFSIFQLFEIQRTTSLAPLFNRWSSSVDITCSSALESLQSLDQARVFRATLHFPKWRRLRTNIEYEGSSHDTKLYDPVFLMLLVHLTLSDNRPATGFGWIELFRTNVVGVCIRALSSKDLAVRNLGISQLASMLKCIESEDFQEKAHVMHVLNLLKNLLPPPQADEPPRRLPSYTTLILAYALRGIFYPSNFIYPLTARFLLQRPELDDNDVPMLYSMLYSNADDWKKERSWIIRFLADGMASSDDWKVLKRRHTWDLLASLFQSSESDHALRRGAFEVIANLTCNRQAVMNMILKSSFLTWLEMQISPANADDDVKWAKVLGNVTSTVDHTKLDLILKSGWRRNICRCLCILLNRINADATLSSIVPIIFALGKSSDLPIAELEESVHLAVKGLRKFESRLQISSGSENSEMLLKHELSPSYAINEISADPNPCRVWLICVTLLWRTSMVFDHKILPWDWLTCRLLAYPCQHNLEQTTPGWARREVVQSLAGCT
ncbi:hypothetical protein P691DRAFT_805556 [Macrolepiota fuliginosa MF-IS2]|uniref:Nucleolar pre-ribosomal-associated protein 1 n=1 Tax=Macrolepiota fuliginosa MF-IS2 TaxID=1400762 RepID=A0A9P6C1G4_9AGAR|nr:hypothetical protein P691DRAFT_805556 [Macrolepiota fuliginosa MF-IS2]